jgi:nucleotide-binding universal stress UspA family protein
MNSNILLAVDSSESSMKAVRYVAGLLGNNHDISVTLFHALPPVPPALMESGTLQEADEIHRKEAAWEEAEHKIECKCLEPMIDILKQAGFREEQIQTKHSAPPPEFDVAHVILEECEEGDYDTVVMGKRGMSRVKSFLVGSVTEKVFRHSKGMAVWVIE